jgi:peptidyl-prolyl cis-trans isomerase C
MRVRLAGALGFTMLGLACADPPPAPVVNQHLPEGTVASVAGEALSASSIARIAERRRTSLSNALDLAVSDAVLAQGARQVAARGVTASIERGASARALLEVLAAESSQRGPATSEELDAIVRERWTELDRPAGVRTTHAVVMVKEPEQDAKARALAGKIALSVASAVTPDEFEKLVKLVPAGSADVRVEQLPVVLADGRAITLKDGVYVQSAEFDSDFARAANALTEPGQLSPVVRSRFGYHVIRLEERVAGATVRPEQRASLLGPEALTRRASHARTELLEKLRAAAPIEVDRAFDDLTARVRVETTP